MDEKPPVSALKRLEEQHLIDIAKQVSDTSTPSLRRARAHIDAVLHVRQTIETVEIEHQLALLHLKRDRGEPLTIEEKRFWEYHDRDSY